MGNVQQHIGKVAVIGRYEIEVVKYLGEGGSSFIFLVKSTSTGGTLMVLKRLLADSDASFALLESETRMHARFRHPQVVEFFASRADRRPGSSTREVFILMEYCPKGHLHDNMMRMGEKRFTQADLLRTFRSLCVPVLELHHANPPVAHRDLKLENFLLSKTGVYKLCDFGSCVEGPQSLRTKAERHHQEELVLQRTTAMYRSPELADIEGTAMFGSGELTEAVDIWAMGCILFTMAFFKPPFPPEGLRTDKYTIPATSSYSADVHAIIARMLTADVERRATLDHIVFCIDEVLQGHALPPLGKEGEARAERQSKPSAVKTTEARKEAVASKAPALAVDLLGMDYAPAPAKASAAPSAGSEWSNPPAAAAFADFASFPSPTASGSGGAVAPVAAGMAVPAGKRIDEFGFPVSPVKQQQQPQQPQHQQQAFGFGSAPMPPPHQQQHPPSFMTPPPAVPADPFAGLAGPGGAQPQQGYGYGQPGHMQPPHGYPGGFHGVPVPHPQQQQQQQQQFQQFQQFQQPGWGQQPNNRF